MKYPIATFLLSLFLFSCGNGKPSQNVTLTGQGNLDQTEKTLAQRAAESAGKPGIDIPNTYQILEVRTANLDMDKDDEQIILLQSKDNLSLPLKIYAVDFDPDRHLYFKSWESDCLARGNQHVILEIDDVVGDQFMEVIVAGFDDQGRSTLNLFRRNKKDQPLSALQYKSAFSMASFGTIIFDRSVRSASAGASEIPASFPILIEEDNPESSSILDTIKTTYQWQYNEEQYVWYKKEPIRKANLADTRLLGLLNGTNQELEKFLKGPWNNQTVQDQEKHILFFDPEAKTITFVSGKTQEVYKWELTNRTFRSGLYLLGSNQIYPTIKLQMSVSITGLDSLQVTVPDDSSLLNGTYQKAPSSVTGPAADTTLPTKKAKIISGLFKNDRGMEITFDLPTFTLAEKGIKYTGAGSIFNLGQDLVLQLKLLKEDGLKQEVRNYKMELSESRASGRMIRTLLLYPSKLVYTGLQVERGDPLVLEQQETNSETTVK